MEKDNSSFCFCFSFPKSSCAKSSSVDSKFSKFVTASSYPSRSTNATSMVDMGEDKFINCNSPNGKSRRSKSASFRTRNRFIIARSVLGKMLKHYQKDVNTISKVISLVWKRSSKSVHDYFEYLSLVEGHWYDNFNSGRNGRPYVPNKLSYTNACSSSYSKVPKVVIPTQNYSRGAKFKIAINHKVSKPKRAERAASLNSRVSINSCHVATWLGILTEDVFSNDF